MPENQTPHCIHCGRDDSQVPLLVLLYKGSQFQICSEHLPILLHNPAKLSGKLAGADSLLPAEHD
jgi:hypothetical protein